MQLTQLFFLKNISIDKKFLIVSAAFITPIAFLFYSYISNKNQEISYAEKKLQGLKFMPEVVNFINLLQQHRSVSVGYLYGTVKTTKRIIEYQTKIENTFAKIDSLNYNYKELNLSEPLEALKIKCKKLAESVYELKPQECLNKHMDLIDDVIQFIIIIADNSNLKVETEMSSYYMSVLTTDNLLRAIEYSGRLRALGLIAISKPSLTSEDIYPLEYYKGIVSEAIKISNIELQKVFSSNSSIGEELKSEWDNLKSNVEKFINFISANFTAEGKKNIDTREYFTLSNTVLENSFKFWESSYNKLNSLLEERISNEKKNRLISFLLTIFALSFAFTIFLAISKYLTKSILELKKAASEVAIGNIKVKSLLNSNDELGSLSKSFNIMVENIKNSKEALEREKASVEKKVQEAIEQSEKERKYLSDSVDIMIKAFEKFETGDLTTQIDLNHEDDIGKLFKSFNHAVERLKLLVYQILEAAKVTSASSSEISTSSEELAAAAQELSSQINDISISIKEMTSTILDVSKNIVKVAENSKRAVEIAENGGKVIRETISEINKIADVVDAASKMIQELGNSSRQIGDIIKVIEDIADQTNLLALNAAIEAARAGEYGRGFSVVADEVRKLSEKTAKATKEISAMIKTIQSDTKNAVDSIIGGVEIVQSGKNLAFNAENSLSKIIESINQNLDLSNQVAASTEELSSSAEQISKNVESINMVTTETAAGIQHIAKASNDLKKLTEKLNNIVLNFKISENIKM